MSKIDELRAVFFQESEDLLEQLADGLEALATGGADEETIHSVFRAVHSIKGGAAAFTLSDVVAFAHRYETVLDCLRNGTLDKDAQVLDTVTRAADHLATLVEAARDELPADVDASHALIAEFDVLSGGIPAGAQQDPAFTPTTIDLGDLGVEDAGSGSENGFSVHFVPGKGLYDSGNEPAFLLRDLCAMGDARVACDLAALPDFDDLDPGQSYLGWTVDLYTEAPETALREVFEFVDGLCALTISPLASQSSVSDAKPDGDDVAANALAVAAAPVTRAAEGEAPRVGGGGAARVSEMAMAQAQPVASTVRVELHRIDRMINLVGELVINQAMLAQCIKRAEIQAGSEVDVALDELRTLTRQIQDSVMAIRAQPVKALFQRMSRIAREAASDVGKTVRVETIGASTEIDKTVIEKLADPLTHMIRNAVDHGVEGADRRRAGGKDATGTIRLSAAHRSGRVVIEISDDGAGLDRARVRSIAEEKGLIAPDASLTNAELDNLIFMPGFSTASALSALSGRGVGMDVVRRAIQQLGGRVTIASEAGRGSTFTIVLPLTLAVLDGMVIEVGGQTVVVPISAIVETMRMQSGQIFRLGTDSTVVRIRGTYVPVIDVGAAMGYRPPVSRPEDHVFLLIETTEGARAAFLIDAIHDQRQVVIKGLEENYGHVDGVAAATILGDGRIALILDPSAIVGACAGAKSGTDISLAAAE